MEEEMELSLSPADYAEYVSLRSFFRPANGEQTNRHAISFLQELGKIVSFIERRQDGKEERAIACGIFFSPMYVCVNTRQLMGLLGRCKSSINNSFQQLGYSSLKTNSRAQSFLLACLHSLALNSPLRKQWTVRYLMSKKVPVTPPRLSSLPLPILPLSISGQKDTNEAELPNYFEPEEPETYFSFQKSVGSISIDNSFGIIGDMDIEFCKDN